MIGGGSVEIRGYEDRTGSGGVHLGGTLAEATGYPRQGIGARRCEEDGLGSLRRFTYQSGRAREGGSSDEVVGFGLENHLHPVASLGDLANDLGGSEGASSRPDRVEDQAL